MFPDGSQTSANTVASQGPESDEGKNANKKENVEDDKNVEGCDEDDSDTLPLTPQQNSCRGDAQAEMCQVGVCG
jgi:hypothetical protein